MSTACYAMLYYYTIHLLLILHRITRSITKTRYRSHGIKSKIIIEIGPHINKSTRTLLYSALLHRIHKGKMAGELEDISSWIKGAASGKRCKSARAQKLIVDLPVGHMIKKSDLPLVDAMNSIELFNSKMDTGMAGPSSSNTSKNASSSSDGSKLFDPRQEFTPEEILWIMDEMTAAEVSLLPAHVSDE